MKHALCLSVLLLPFIAATAQSGEYELYERSPDSCGYVMLYQDGTFYLNSGCKSESSAGSWWQANDTVFFLPRDPARIRAVQSTTAFFTPGDTIFVQVLSSGGENISEHAQLYLQVPDGGGVIPFTPFQNRSYLTNPPADARLLLKVLGQEIQLPLGFANNFIVKLNIPGEWAFAPGWCQRSQFYLLKKDGKLMAPGEIVVAAE